MNSLDVEITNEFAESIFTVTYSTVVDGGILSSPVIAVNAQRVEGRETFRDVIKAPYGSDLVINVNTVSLGEPHSFGPINGRASAENDLHLVYEYDSALGGFALSSAWR